MPSSVIAFFHSKNDVQFDYDNGEHNFGWICAQADLETENVLLSGFYKYKMNADAEDVSIHDVEARLFVHEHVIYVMKFKATYYDIVPSNDMELTTENLWDFHMKSNLLDILSSTLSCRFPQVHTIVFEDPEVETVLKRNEPYFNTIDELDLPYDCIYTIKTDLVKSILYN